MQVSVVISNVNFVNAYVPVVVSGIVKLVYVQYCEKVMIANFVEFRALFSTKFRRNFVELSLWRHAKFPLG